MIAVVERGLYVWACGSGCVFKFCRKLRLCLQKSYYVTLGRQRERERVRESGDSLLNMWRSLVRLRSLFVFYAFFSSLLSSLNLLNTPTQVHLTTCILQFFCQKCASIDAEFSSTLKKKQKILLHVFIVLLFMLCRRKILQIISNSCKSSWLIMFPSLP